MMLSENDHITNVCRGASRKLNTFSGVSSLLSYQQEKVVSNFFISRQFNYCSHIWMLSSIRYCKKINKLRERSFRLCKNNYTWSYDKLLRKQGLVNIHIRKNQKLIIDIFKCLKSLFPAIMNEIFMLRNVPYKRFEGSR